MSTIYLVDYLGIHCGMHYYDVAFKEVLSDIPGCKVEILSNYADVPGEKPFFINQYKGNIIKKGTSLIRNLMKLRKFSRRHIDDIFIYLTYGNSIDLRFLEAFPENANLIVDIHEAIAQDVDTNKKLKERFHKFYMNPSRDVISHSERTDDFLKEYNFKGHAFHVPHFKYTFPKDYKLDSIPSEVIEAVSKDKINLLFFGNLNESKGVDLLMEAINELPDEEAGKLNFIIAGKDFDGSVNRVALKPNRNVSIFARHITDDELRYLYQNTDYLTLPYRKTSQSGILEMAFYFKKPILASDIPYFRTTLEEFPTFGELAGNSVKDYVDCMCKVATNHGKKEYFSDTDYARYENRKEVEDFKKELKEYI